MVFQDHLTFQLLHHQGGEALGTVIVVNAHENDSSGLQFLVWGVLGLLNFEIFRNCCNQPNDLTIFVSHKYVPFREEIRCIQTPHELFRRASHLEVLLVFVQAAL